MKQIFLALSMLSSFCFGMQITRAGQDYSVFDGIKSHAVKPYMVDPLLKRMNPEQLQRFVEQGNRIKAIKLSDGDYRLQANIPGLGGGPVGAVVGAAVGKAGTHVVCHGAIYGISALVGFFCPPAGVATGMALEGILAIPIEALSVTVAVSTGIAGAVLTGPV